jgi:hypothetical protein
MLRSPVSERFPSMTRYLESLPGGIDAYPEAQAKGAILRMLLEDDGFKLPADALPAALAAHTAAPPAVNAWVPEVHFNAYMLAVFDEYYAKAGGTVAYEKWIHTRNRRLFRSPLFRILFAVVSPERLLVGIEKRWAAFRRGSEMRVLEHTPGAARLAWRHPRNLVTDLSARGLATAFRAGLELAGARETTMTYVLAKPDETIFTGSWGK